MSDPNTDTRERCDLCGRVAEDVTFDYLGPDSNDIDLERWGYSCGEDKGCDAVAVRRAAYYREANG